MIRTNARVSNYGRRKWGAHSNGDVILQDAKNAGAPLRFFPAPACPSPKEYDIARYGHAAPVKTSVSMRTPGADTASSVPIRKRSLMVCPFTFDPRFTI